jgi:hypothetical protein
MLEKKTHGAVDEMYPAGKDMSIFHDPEVPLVSVLLDGMDCTWQALRRVLYGVKKTKRDQIHEMSGS